MTLGCGECLMRLIIDVADRNGPFRSRSEFSIQIATSVLASIPTFFLFKVLTLKWTQRLDFEKQRLMEACSALPELRQLKVLSMLKKNARGSFTPLIAGASRFGKHVQRTSGKPLSRPVR